MLMAYGGVGAALGFCVVMRLVLGLIWLFFWSCIAILSRLRDCLTATQAFNDVLTP